MKKRFLTFALAALGIASTFPAFAEHEWTVNGSVIENDLWTLNQGWNNGTLTLSSATPKVDGLTTLDVSEMNLWNKPLSTLQSWQNSNVQAVKKLIIPYQLNGMTTEFNALPNLEEICTPDGGHELSIKGWGKSIVNNSSLAGDYVVKDITAMGAQNGNGAFYQCPNLSSLVFRGSYPSICEKVAFLSYGVKSIDFETTATIAEIPSYLYGHWGDQASSPSPCQLTSVTLNGKTMLRCADITKVGSSVMPHAKLYTGIVDLPNCTSVGEYAFRDTGIPFINLMSVSALGKNCFYECKDLSRVVFGAESFASKIGTDILSGNAFSQASDASVIWNCKTKPTFDGPCFRDLSMETKEIKNYVRKEANWLVENTSSRPFVKKDGDGKWCLYDWTNQTKRQPLIEMDTVFKVNLRLGDKVVMTTLMPGVSGENPVWTIPASWFLAAGQTFGVGAVKDENDYDIEGASAIPDESGLNLTITLPASLVESAENATQEGEVFVDIVAQENTDPQIVVSIVDENENLIVEERFEATVGTSAQKDYSTAIFGENEYYYNNVLSLTVDPETALTASLDLTGKLSLENIAKDATVIAKIDRRARPAQFAYWNVDGNTLSDGVWTFRCDFSDGKAVIADAIEYKGADKDVAPVDFTKPIGTDGSSDRQIATLDWGAVINGSAIDTTKTADHCGKDVVINGGTGTARTLVGALKFPATVEAISGWGYCENLTADPTALAKVTTFGKYALAYTAIEGAIAFADDHVVAIGNSAFEKCIKVTSLCVPALGSTIGEKAFYHCVGLKTVELGGVIEIGWAAFSRDDGDHTMPGIYSLEKVVLSPALKKLNGSTFYKSTKSGCVFDAVLPKNLPAAESGDGVISGNDFQDLGAGSIVIPFKGTCTIGAKVFHWSSTTNFIFWGKAPAAWIGNSTAVYDAMKDFNTGVKTDRMLTVSLTMDQAGWEGVATTLKKNCDAGEWAALNPPEKAFGYVMANTTRIWLCAGKSPWEKRGLALYIR